MKRRTCAPDHMLCTEAMITGPSVTPKRVCDMMGMIKVCMVVSIGACHINQHENMLGECVHVLSVSLTQCNHERLH